MAHVYRKYARHVQKTLEASTGARPAYQWCLWNVEKHLNGARAKAKELHGGEVKNALVAIIAPFHDRNKGDAGADQPRAVEGEEGT